MDENATTDDTVKKILEVMVKKADDTGDYDKVESYISNLYTRPHGRDILGRLSKENSGLEKYIRTLIKEHIEPYQFIAMNKGRMPTSKQMFNMGGTRRKRRRKQTRKKSNHLRKRV